MSLPSCTRQRRWYSLFVCVYCIILWCAGPDIHPSSPFGLRILPPSASGSRFRQAFTVSYSSHLAPSPISQFQPTRTRPTVYPSRWKLGWVSCPPPPKIRETCRAPPRHTFFKQLVYEAAGNSSPMVQSSQDSFHLPFKHTRQILHYRRPYRPKSTPQSKNAKFCDFSNYHC